MTGVDVQIDDLAAPSAARGLSPRGKLLLAAVVIVVVIVAVALFARHRLRGRYYEDTNDAYIRADSVAIAPKISGYVDQVLVRDNQDVRAGQPLVRIDARDYRAQSSQSEAQIAVALANTENARAAVLEQRAAIVRAQAQLATAQANARYAAAEAARYAPLAASGAETREQFARLQNQAVQARNSVAEQRAMLLGARRRIATLTAQVRQSQAQGRGARAQLDSATVNLGSTLIRASIAGRIGDRFVQPGQYAPAGTRLMSVVPLSGLYVVANFKETQIAAMRRGQPVAIRVDALDGLEVRGHVESISPGTGATFSLLPPQNATGNFTKIVQRVPVRIAIDAGPAARAVLVPGLSVEVEVDTYAARHVAGDIERQERARNGDRK